MNELPHFSEYDQRIFEVLIDVESFERLEFFMQHENLPATEIIRRCAALIDISIKGQCLLSEAKSDEDYKNAAKIVAMSYQEHNDTRFTTLGPFVERTCAVRINGNREFHELFDMLAAVSDVSANELIEGALLMYSQIHT